MTNQLKCRLHAEGEQFCPACSVTERLLTQYPQLFQPDHQYVHVLVVDPTSTRDAHDLRELLLQMKYNRLIDGNGVIQIDSYCTDRVEIQTHEGFEYHEYDENFEYTDIATGWWKRCSCGDCCK